MKKIALAVAALLISVSAMAGNNYKLPFVSFGIKAGYTTNQQKIDYKALLNAETIKKNASGFNAGIVARVDFPLLPIYVQGELLYDWGKYKDVSLTGLNPTSVTTNNFSVPVLVGVGIGSSNFVKVRANVGPVFNLVSTAKFLECGKRGRPRKHVPETDRNLDRRHRCGPVQHHGGHPLQRRLLEERHRQHRRPRLHQYPSYELDVHHRLSVLKQSDRNA